MYSNKENINILVSLLLKHGVTNAVVCPGSRNAAIIHDLHESGMRCYPVTDERSAGFFALGIAQATNAPVVVCVTSGTALLDVAPAVAEATYQHNGIVVISADRPSAWIGQNDGQTMPQPNALGTFVGKCVNIPEPHTADERWQVNRMVNEALIETKRRHRPSVHINVPLAQPLFEYTVETLPDERVITLHESAIGDITPLAEAVKNAKRPMIVCGQTDDLYSQWLSRHEETENVLEEHFVMLTQSCSCIGNIYHADEILYCNGDNEALRPDLVIHLGGDVVSKRVKNFIRNIDCDVWAITNDGSIFDTFKHATHFVEGDTMELLNALVLKIKDETIGDETAAYLKTWDEAEETMCSHAANFQPAYSQMAAVKQFEQIAFDKIFFPHTHYANSSSIRLANIFAERFVWCNRGVNGIDGSVSTAAGFASQKMEKVDTTILVTGDLSFFYDQNALWNDHLNGNFRILLLNNGEGGIFRQVKNFGENPMAVGRHKTTAEGICKQNDVTYIAAHNMRELEEQLIMLVLAPSQRPILLEVFTDAETDTAEYKRYYHSLT